MIASLPMYDRAETRAANDRLWSRTRAALADTHPEAPETLTRDGDPWPHWMSPALFLSQTCGLPYRQRLSEMVSLVAAPHHGLGDPPGRYHSVIVVRDDDTREGFEAFSGARLAVNDMRSQSGWAAPQVMARERGFVFADILATGSHVASAMAVAMRAADIAAIDVVSWGLMTRFDAFTSRLRVIDRTPATPALPFITARAELAPALAAALGEGIAAIGPDDRELLCLEGVVPVGPADYDAVALP